MNIYKIKHLFKQLIIIFMIIGKGDKARIINALFLTVSVSFLDIFTVASLYPFLSICFSKELEDSSFVQNFPNIGNFLIKNFDSVYVISTAYIFIIFASLIIKIFIMKKTGDDIAVVSNNLSSMVYVNTIFSRVKKSDSSEVVNNLILRCNYAMGAMINLTNIFGSVVIITGIIITLLYFNSIATLILFTVLLLIYLIVGAFTSKISVKNSEIVDELSLELISHFKQTIGNIKNIIVENRIQQETEFFKNTDKKIRNARLSNQLLNNIPRVSIESFLIFSVVIFSLYVYRSNLSISEYIPIIGLFIVAFQKIMPSFNSIYVNISNIFQASDSINKLADQIEKININDEISNQGINFENLTVTAVSNVQFGSNDLMYKPVNLSVNVGDKYFISGVSGVGKTTFMESLIGLLSFDTGIIFLNGKPLDGAYLQSWWNSIAYIPQSPFIFSKSIFYNITLKGNLSDIDFKKFNHIVSILELGYVVDRVQNERLSEDGKNLSGGERQRIVLARALYSGRKILFFDEALGAIDQNTRIKILSSVFNEFCDLTIFYISHNQVESFLFSHQLVISK